jgi:hypothetical protein
LRFLPTSVPWPLVKFELVINPEDREGIRPRGASDAVRAQGDPKDKHRSILAILDDFGSRFVQGQTEKWCAVVAFERLFVIVKPKLLTLNWFARLWTWLVGLRAARWLKAVKVMISGWISSVRHAWL